MSRVAQLDSRILDDELHSVLLRDLNHAIYAGNDENEPGHLGWKNTDEWRLVCDTLLYMFVVKKGNNGWLSLLRFISNSKSQKLKGKEVEEAEEEETYGTRLNGLSYKSPMRGTLYLTAVLSKYLLAKSDKVLPSQNKRLVKLLRLLTSLAEVLNFANFIVTGNYISILNRILGLKMASKGANNIMPLGQFSEQSRLATMEVQNRQLLWNAVLELLNMTVLLPNSRTFFYTWQSKTEKHTTAIIGSQLDIRHCSLCNEPPSNPYILDCCQATYCYWCCCKVLEWRQCSNCKEKGLLQASPLYTTV
ncbi:similar to Saccharomyces cerevisiae YJL210W PEX2 RING-finger peroxin and E3 ubiquitin ligase [Maudiozyma saulgeensis]|uniref:RING-type E3 ubiquitin transferase n=1 Tax=Maudiozyma saulgeensis TaxID=1789683 RepID=A0A1X7QWW2_9SACH|nr:similar to Saccharomyces cerevisiae YJL210W PEX2 RING-finger peroxin and E3 ubiquitin ligase [Kazachstania saulgeensis]